MLQGLPLSRTLVDGGEVAPLPAYIARMSVPEGGAPTAEQWGGFAEARVASHMWDVTVYIVGHVKGNEYQLYTEPFKPQNPVHCTCLIYSGGSHFDLLLVDSPAALIPLEA